MIFSRIKVPKVANFAEEHFRVFCISFYFRGSKWLEIFIKWYRLQKLFPLWYNLEYVGC